MDPLLGLERGVPAAEADWRGQPLSDSLETPGGEKPGGILREWGPQESWSNAGTPRHPAVLGNLAFLSWEDDKHRQTSRSGTDGEKGQCAGHPSWDQGERSLHAGRTPRLGLQKTGPSSANTREESCCCKAAHLLLKERGGRADRNWSPPQTDWGVFLYRQPGAEPQTAREECVQPVH